MEAWRSISLAAAQLAAFVYILVYAEWPSMPLWFRVPATAGFVTGVWAVWTMGLRRLRIRPEPHPEAVLLTRGPYRYVRHPMYTAVLLMGLSGAAGSGTPDLLTMAVLLVVVLFFKVRLEERMLLRMFPDYGEYRRRTGAVLPRLIKTGKGHK